jgi:ADP-ribosyl-[dinitrogen reductase] hydrolase
MLDEMPAAYLPLLGVALGDALGAGIEGGHALERALRDNGPQVGREFLPYSPFGFAPGEVTDDTQMALAALLAEGPPPVLEDVGGPRRFLERRLEAYRSWYRSRPPDVGMATGSALSAGQLDGGFRSWRGGQSAGNGSLMRAVSAVVEGYRGEDLLLASALDSALTHPDPRCVAACVLNNAIIEDALDRAAPEAFGDTVLHSCARARKLDFAFLDAFPIEDPSWRAAFEARWSDELGFMISRAMAALDGLHVDCERTGHQEWPTGFVVDTWQQAMWAAAHGELATDAIHLAVRHGGRDADTIGAIGGGLAAARFGRPALANWKWKETAELRLGHDLAGHRRGARIVEVLDAHLGRPVLSHRL